MIDNTKVNHYEEQLFGAFNIIAENRLKRIKYDQTVLCKIIDDKEKKNGKYKVEDLEGLKFDAYSEKTDYSKNTQVYVTVPQGDYTGQKIIIGKATGKDEIKPYNYVSPFERFFPMTDNLVGLNNNSYGLAANDDGTNSVIENLPNGDDAGTAVLVARVSDQFEMGHKILGVKADFQSLIPEAVKGNYGLIIKVVNDKENTYYYSLSISDMIGNPYNYKDFYTQETLIDLAEFEGAIKNIEVYFAQVKGSFVDIEGNEIPVGYEYSVSSDGDYKFEDNKYIKIEDGEEYTGVRYKQVGVVKNLFVKQIYIAAGFLITDKQEEFVEIYSPNGMEFNGNKDGDITKDLKLRWAHKDKDGTMYNMERASGQSKFPNYEIRWYRYKAGAPASDKYSSIYWEEINKLSLVNGKGEEITNMSSTRFQILNKDKNGDEKPEYTNEYCRKYKISLEKGFPLKYNVNNLINPWPKEYIYYTLIPLHVDTVAKKIQRIEYSENSIGEINLENVVFQGINSTDTSIKIQDFLTGDNNTVDFSVYLKPHQDFGKEKVVLNKEASIEKFKAIVFVDGVPYTSNVLQFDNSKKPEVQVTKFTNPLTILPDDGSNGNYMLYGQDHNILEQSLAKRPRTLKAYFDTEPEDGRIGDELVENDVARLRWTFPAINTMIKLQDLDTINTYIGEDKNGKDYIFEEIKALQEGDSAIEGNEKKYFLDEQRVYFYKGNKYAYSYQNEKWEIVESNIVNLPAYHSYIVEKKGTPPQYTIESRWLPSATNNTVFCSYTDQQGASYSASKEFTFGVAGTMGTEQTLVIDFADNSSAVNMNDDDYTVKFKVQLYDLSGKNLSISAGMASWKWKGTTIELSNQEELSLPRSTNFTNMNDIKILECSVGPLTTYFPVPLCSDTSEYKYIDGPTQVIYKPDSVPQMYKAEYKIYNANGNEVDGVTWNIIYPSGETLVGQPTIENNLLKPYSLYLQNATQYAVQAKLKNEKTEEEVIWTQPILTIMNRWPSNIINSWSGTELVINNENNTIITQAFAAGKKDEENTFTGVMLGDWSEKNTDETITKNTGLYGFHKGEMSYAFKDDGTAFIGKSGLGRIYFNGSDEGTIKSAQYNKASATIDLEDKATYKGLNLDFLNGKIDLLKNVQIDIWNEEAGEKKSVREKSGILMNIEDVNYPLQIGAEGQMGEKRPFSVGWDGSLYASKAIVKGSIDAISGSIGNAFNVEEQQGGNSIVNLSGMVNITEGSLAFVTTNGSVNLQGGENIDNMPYLRMQALTNEFLLGAGVKVGLDSVHLYANANSQNNDSRLQCDSDHIGISILAKEETIVQEDGNKKIVKDQTYISCYPKKIEIGTQNNIANEKGANTEPYGTIDFLNNKIINARIQFG